MPARPPFTPSARSSSHIVSATLTVFLAALCLFNAPAAHAYDDDTHYAFTYYMARAVGYTPMQAQRIASADVAVDAESNTGTEPVQGGLNITRSLSIRAQRIRIKYHAMLDQIDYNACLVDSGHLLAPSKEDLEGAITRQIVDGNFLEGYCRKQMRNPGVYLHFLQDRYAHWGYGSLFGHYNPHDARILHGMPFGSKTDYLSFDPETYVNAYSRRWFNQPRYDFAINRNEKMVDATLNALQKFKVSMETSYASVTSAPSSADVQSCNDLLTALRTVNQVPTNIDYIKNYSVKLRPDFKAAYNTVNSFLASRKDFDRMPPQIDYQFSTAPFDAKGCGGDILMNQNLRDDMTLYGDLTVILPRGIPAGAQVTLKLAQTRMNEQTQTLDLIGQAVGERSLRFKGCPVGLLIASIASPYGSSMDYTVAVTRQQNTYELLPLQLNIQPNLTTNKKVWNLNIRMGSMGIMDVHCPTFLPWGSDGAAQQSLQKDRQMLAMPPFSPLLMDPRLAQQAQTGDALLQGYLSQQIMQKMTAVAKEQADEANKLKIILDNYAAESKNITVKVGNTTLSVVTETTKLKPPFNALFTAQMMTVTQAASKIMAAAVADMYPNNPQIQKAAQQGTSELNKIDLDTEINCEISAAQMETLEGPLTVSYGTRTWQVGWIDRCDIDVTYMKGYPESDPQTGGFHDDALQIGGEGTLSVHLLLAKPLDTSKGLPPEVAGRNDGVVSADHYIICPQLLSSVFHPKSFEVAGNIHSGQQVTSARVTQKYDQQNAGGLFIQDKAAQNSQQAQTLMPPTLFPADADVKAIHLAGTTLSFGRVAFTTTSDRFGSPPNAGMGNSRPTLNDLFPAQPVATSVAPASGDEFTVEASWCLPNGLAFTLNKDMSIEAGNFQVQATPAGMRQIRPQPSDPRAGNKFSPFSYRLSWPRSSLKYQGEHAN